MDFRFTEAELAFQKEVEDFLSRELTPEAIEESDSYFGYGPASREFLRKLGARGWLCPSWPREYGGIGASHMQSFVLQEALCYWRAPNTRTGGLVGASMSGPTIMRVGSEEQKREWLPHIARGEIEFALGYTEPQAGSDLASLEIRAV
ncbi:MAG: acyl-CoA dehydrogenase family protein, partial [Dehalococcoidia bacterium]|nr:acyl-CoA dehydrogenase family protein [Dehalococcoidia bacterium]